MAIGVSSVLFTGCFGSFGLSKEVYKFNKGLGDKFVQEAVFLALSICQVYSVTLFVDAIILNSIEFWTGSNPIAMEKGQTETKVLAMGDEKVTITATHNKFTFVSGKGEKAEMVFNTYDNSWYLSVNNNLTKLATYNNARTDMMVYLPNGKKALLNGNESTQQLRGLILNQQLVANK
jgi:hypothetical protein